MSFTPDYNNIVDCAYNRVPKRIPLYEHNVSPQIIGEIVGKDFEHLLDGSVEDKNEFFKIYCSFFKDYGYDVVTFEECITSILPNGGCLALSSTPPAITDRETFESYPWNELEKIYFEKTSANFEALRRNMPEGMKAIGGVGNGVFECVQDLVGYENLCYLSVDDPDLYADLFKRVGEISRSIWSRFIKEFGDIYCVLRIGDDLGFRTQTLLSIDDIKTHIIPVYKSIIDLVHAAGKPFLLHSCGKIFDIMDSLINDAKIDAKHSNEDQIAPFSFWVDTYGDKIGNFGGIDTDALCRLSPDELKDYIEKVLNANIGKGGFAFGSGNSIPNYVPANNYCNMIQIVRKYRGDF